MHLLIVLLLMVLFPIASVFIESIYFANGASLLALIGKWFVFWGVGLRLMLAAVSQIAQPSFTAQTIFRIQDPAALVVIRELGFANFAIGSLGLLSIVQPGWTLPAAIAGAIFYGLAGANHTLRPERTASENVAMISDLYIFAVLAIYSAAAILGAA